MRCFNENFNRLTTIAKEIALIGAVRKIWRVTFYLISLMIVYWFFVNLFRGNLVNDPKYFLSTGAVLLVAPVVVYRIGDIPGIYGLEILIYLINTEHEKPP